MTSPTPDRPASTPDASAPEEASVADAPDAAPQPEESEPEEPEGLTLLVDPKRVRRAPRYRAFFTTGALVGIVLGLGFGLWLAGNVDPSRGDFPLQKPGVYVTVIVASTTTVTVLIAGFLAVLADRRSLRRR